MNKKVLIILGVITGICIIYGGVTYAEELREGLELYLQNDKLDFLGRGYDKMLFDLLEGEDATILDKIKAIPLDIKTIPFQLECNWKMFNQKPNMVAYGSLGYLSALKTTLGAKAFNRFILQLVKSVKMLK